MRPWLTGRPRGIRKERKVRTAPMRYVCCTCCRERAACPGFPCACYNFKKCTKQTTPRQRRADITRHLELYLKGKFASLLLYLKGKFASLLLELYLKGKFASLLLIFYYNKMCRNYIYLIYFDDIFDPLRSWDRPRVSGKANKIFAGGDLVGVCPLPESSKNCSEWLA